MHLFPAQAGVILLKAARAELKMTVPRASGGDPDLKRFEEINVNCSPRKRG